MVQKAGRAGTVCALLAAILFGIGGIFAQSLLHNHIIPVQTLVLMRLIGAGAVLLVLSALRDGTQMLNVWKKPSDALSLLLFGIFGMLSVQYTYFAAIRSSNAPTATILQYTAPAMIAVWLALHHRRWPKPHVATAVALAFIGTLLLVTHGHPSTLSLSPQAVGWGLASALAASFNSIQPVGLLKRYGPSQLTGWAMLIGGVTLTLIAQPNLELGAWQFRTYAFVGFIVGFGTLLAFYLYLKAVHLIGPQSSSLLTCAEPLTAAILSVWWLGVSFDVMDWLGSLCILSTIVLLAKDQSIQSQLEKTT